MLSFCCATPEMLCEATFSRAEDLSWFLILLQVNSLLEKELVEEAVLLAETIAAVEASKDPRFAEEVRVVCVGR
jgi:hypothetical protein